MKFVKSNEWFYLRGQVGPNNKRCAIDTAVKDKERVFFVPETADELAYFDMDRLLMLTGIPIGPVSLDAENGDWGWRFYSSRTMEDMQKFAESIDQSMKGIYEQGVAVNQGKKPILN